MTQQEAYNLLGIGRTSFYNLVKAGAITPVDVGGIPRYRRSDIETIAQDGLEASKFYIVQTGSELATGAVLKN